MELKFVDHPIKNDDHIHRYLQDNDPANYFAQSISLLRHALTDLTQVGHSKNSDCKNHQLIEKFKFVGITRLEWPAITKETAHGKAAENKDEYLDPRHP